MRLDINAERIKNHKYLIISVQNIGYMSAIYIVATMVSSAGGIDNNWTCAGAFLYLTCNIFFSGRAM